jgi:hypothetical protein
MVDWEFAPLGDCPISHHHGFQVWPSIEQDRFPRQLVVLAGKIVLQSLPKVYCIDVVDDVSERALIIRTTTDL